MIYNLQIHPDSESTEFLLELSSFLKELGCPYSCLVSGPTAQRYQSKQDRSLLLTYLLSELMAAKMSHKLNPHKKVLIEIVSCEFMKLIESSTVFINNFNVYQFILCKF